MSERKPIHKAAYVLSGVGFLPLLGIPFAAAAIIWGLKRARSGGARLIVLGCCGVLTTVVVYGCLFYFGFVQRGGVYDEMRRELAVKLMLDIVDQAELFKLQHGAYPADLPELSKFSGEKNPLFIEDPIVGAVAASSFFGSDGMKNASTEAGSGLFYYQPLNGGYYLFSRGLDGEPFTADDVFPDIPENRKSAMGYRAP